MVEGRLAVYAHRVRLAAWLAWNALRGRTYTLQVGSLDGHEQFVAVPRR